MKPYGMKIDTASSGQQAIDFMKLEDIKYNAIFMDHMMPGMDGIEATARIREIGTAYAKNIPVIALTANAITGSEKMFLNKGFQDFLSKPIDISRLDAVIRHWLRDKTIEIEDRRTVLKDKNNISTPNRRFSDFQIEGLDLKAGLDRFNGDKDAYLLVMRSYTANTKSLLDSIKEVSKENLTDYTITVHGIKGSSHSICANLVGDLAETLEKAAKKGDFEYVSEKAPDLARIVAKLLADLDEMLAKISSLTQKPKKPAPDKNVLNKILEACKTYDMQTVEICVRELENYEYETGGELVHWLWENMQQFNVDEITRKLSEI
jgi:CheY-like chemotaxis protein